VSGIFGHERDDVVMSSFDICSVNQVVRLVKSRRMKWMGHAAGSGGDVRCVHNLARETEGTPRHKLFLPDTKITFHIPVFFLGMVSHCPYFSSLH
jgi:hypothetical protein